MLSLSGEWVYVHVVSSTALLLRRPHSLTVLWLRDCCIGEDGACQLAEALRVNSTLRVLWLQDNPLGERGAKALVESLAYNTSVKLYLPQQYKDMISNSVVYDRVRNRVNWNWLYSTKIKCVWFGTVFHKLVCVLILDYSPMRVVLVQILATWFKAVYNDWTGLLEQTTTGLTSFALKVVNNKIFMYMRSFLTWPPTFLLHLVFFLTM